MNDFIELLLPERTHGNRHYVESDPRELDMALRNDTGEPDNCNSEYIHYLFDSRAAAHYAAAQYYENHGRDYPHEKDFEYTLLHETPQKEWSRTTYRKRQSQVMEFI